MRLIDADELKEEILKIVKEESPLDEKWATGLRYSIKIIDNAPTVENDRPQDVWEDYSVDFYKCPECGYLLNKDCPHCRSKVILPKGGAE